MNNHLDYDTLEFVDTHYGVQFKDRLGSQSPGVMFGAIRIDGKLSPIYVPKDYIEKSLVNKEENNFTFPENSGMRKIVCLVGSTKFKKEYEKANRIESGKGNIVLTVAMYGHIEGLDMNSEEKKVFDEVHMDKIKMANEILVINVGGYIGESTKREIEYAKSLNKVIRFLEPDEESTIADHPCSFEEHNYTKEDISRLIMMQMQDCGLKISSFINISSIGKGFLNDKLSVRIKKNELTKSEIDLLKQLYSSAEELSSTGGYILFIEKETIEKNIDKARERFKITALPPRYDDKFEKLDPNDL